MIYLIFDMDGVIIDSEPIHTALDIIQLKGYGVEVTTKEIERYMGTSSQATWSDIKLRYHLNVSVEHLIKESIELKVDYLKHTNVVAIDGIKELVEACKKKGIKMAVASSSPESYIHKVLRTVDIFSYFDVIVSGDHVKHSKPAPDIFLRTAELLGAKPSECVVIEDSTHGINAAKVAGMYCIGFDNKSSRNQILDQADIQVKKIENIDIDKIALSI